MSTITSTPTAAALRREALTAYLVVPGWEWAEFQTVTVAHGAGITGAIATDPDFTSADYVAAVAVLCEQGITREREVSYDRVTGLDVWDYVNPNWRNVR